MEPFHSALAIRPGEHACLRLPHAEDRERLARAFVVDGLGRGHRVIYVWDRDDAAGLVADLDAIDERTAHARANGQLELHSARDVHAGNGSFDIQRMLDWMRDAHERALADGYPGLSMTAEMTSALDGAHGAGRLAEYERRLVELFSDSTLVFLCQYDHQRCGSSALAELAETHPVDIPPELGGIGRDGYLAAAHVVAGATLRLAGELDFGSADGLAGVLDAHYHGHLQLDLADLRYVDVTGMRALRGRTGQQLTITTASEPVRRLLGLLGWDTDPAIELGVAG